MKKLVFESLDAYLSNKYAGHKKGKMDPAFLEQTFRDILNSDKSAVEKMRLTQEILDDNPYIHEELGEIEGRNKYQEAVQPLIDWYRDLSDDEISAIDREMKKTGLMRTEKEAERRNAPKPVPPLGKTGTKWKTSPAESEWEGSPGLTLHPLKKIFRSLRNEGEYFLPASGRWQMPQFQNVISKLSNVPGVEIEDFLNREYPNSPYSTDKGILIKASPSKAEKIFDIIRSEDSAY